MNSYFSFKQFIIQQDKCAMKVCTDACLFGAWVANKLETEKDKPSNILDIGTGTGLLSLMLAQKITATIHAVEMDENTFTQAKENFENSIFSNQITAYQKDILDFESEEKYDCIISNPPFFENQLKSDDEARNKAMHATTLSLENLLKKIKELLSNKGRAYLLLPFYCIKDFEKTVLSESLYITEIVKINHNNTKPFFRVFIEISRQQKIKIENIITIKNAENFYTEPFKNLLEDYYLRL